MSVSNGQDATAAIFNSAFISRTADSGTISKLDLNRTGSGPQITDTQQAINDGLWTTVVNESISAGGTISSSVTNRFQYRRIDADGVGVNTLSTTPFGVAGGWVDGTVIRLICTSDTRKIRIDHNDIAKGSILNGDVILTKYSTIDLQYDSVLDRWIEVGRSA